MTNTLGRTILWILLKHKGRKSAIRRPDLVKEVKKYHPEESDRSIRSEINLLRKRGELICSAGGINGGYWIAQDWDELNEYIDRELHPRAMDLLEQEKALKAAARKEWGEGIQVNFDFYEPTPPRERINDG